MGKNQDVIEQTILLQDIYLLLFDIKQSKMLLLAQVKGKTIG